MPVRQDLLEILVCPESQQAVAPAPSDLIARLNADIQAGKLRNRGGSPVEAEIQEGLLRQDGKVLYIVDDSIPVMLIEESIEL